MALKDFSENKNAIPILFTSVFIIAGCGILYELLISSMSSYFLGSSILHFSLTIGFFLSAMGLGAYLSRWVKEEDLLWRFIQIELILGVVGGASGIMLYSAYAFTQNYYILAFSLIMLIGALVGIEIPLLTRIVQPHFKLADTLAQVLAFDYLGALVASVIFPLVLVPYLGLMRTAFFIGLLNLMVGLFNLWVFRESLYRWQRGFWIGILWVGIYVIGFGFSFIIQDFLEEFLYNDEVILAKQSPYQRIIVTKDDNDLRLYLNGNLQFSSQDEHRYHEPLVHLPLALVRNPENILFLGAGDGLAVRELLKYSSVKSIDLVDLDKMMTDLAQKHPALLQLNENALNQKMVKIFHQDAYKYLEHNTKIYDLIIIDLPDPSEVSLGKLYSKEFYSLVRKRLTPDGAMVTQSASPFFTKKAFWCITNTLREVFPTLLPYTVHVPSFGQWGFNIALPYKIDKELALETMQNRLFPTDRKHIPLRFLNKETISTLFRFDEDLKEVPTEINTLNTQKLVQYYEKSWRVYNR